MLRHARACAHAAGSSPGPCALMLFSACSRPPESMVGRDQTKRIPYIRPHTLYIPYMVYMAYTVYICIYCVYGVYPVYGVYDVYRMVYMAYTYMVYMAYTVYGVHGVTYMVYMAYTVCTASPWGACVYAIYAIYATQVHFFLILLKKSMSIVGQVIKPSVLSLSLVYFLFFWKKK
jgi:hypothetical protein